MHREFSGFIMSSRNTHEMEKVALLAAAAGLGVYCLHYRRKNNKHQIPIAFLQSPYASELQVAVKLALQCGKNMTDYCDQKGTALEENHDLGIATKGQPEDFCTKVDVENERLVIQGILEKFPSHHIIGEESTGTGKIPALTSAPTWIIDPIDGTTNFASGFPLTCVSIGFCMNGKPVMGTVYAPVTNELYLAVKGFGAFRNGVKITKRTTKKLRDSVLCVEFGYSRRAEAIAKMVGALTQILEHGLRTVRIVGSGVLDLCYVATGRLDAVYAGVAGEGWKPWDYCAGVVVANEAGCVMEAIDQQQPGDFDLYSSSIICAGSRELVQEIRRLIM